MNFKDEIYIKSFERVYLWIEGNRIVFGILIVTK
jgi:hypothetical protein